MLLKKSISTTLLAGLVAFSMAVPAFAADPLEPSGSFTVGSVIGTSTVVEATIPTAAVFSLGTITGNISSKNLEVVNETDGVAIKLVANFDISIAKGVVIIPGTGTNDLDKVSKAAGVAVTTKNIILGADAQTGDDADAAKAALAADGAALAATETISTTNKRIEASVILEPQDLGSDGFGEIALRGYINPNADWKATDVTISGTYTLVGEDSIDPTDDSAVSVGVAGGSVKSTSAAIPGSSAATAIEATAGGAAVDVANLLTANTQGTVYLKLSGASSSTTITSIKSGTVTVAAAAAGSAGYVWDAATQTIAYTALFGSAGDKPLTIVAAGTGAGTYTYTVKVLAAQ